MDQKILIIEDDNDMAALLERHLVEANFIVQRASDGLAGLQEALAAEFDLIVVDLQLPKLTGFDVCKELRNKKPTLPIIILTSRSDEVDKVLGLEMGADDYITKPFGARELTARIRSVLRRSQVAPGAKLQPEVLQFGELVIDGAKRVVTRAGEPVVLTSTEFDLLLFLANHPGRPFTRDQLMEQVWGYQSSMFEATVTTHLSRLRSKIEADPANPLLIQTVRGVGYKFADGA